jgi:agmatinase
MFNVLQHSGVGHLIQVGIRDVCEAEMHIVGKDNRINQFSDQYLSEQTFKGITWMELCDEIVGKLSDKVYVSFDIDGLEPQYCPNTGTPVPGGLNYNQVMYLIKRIVESKRVLVGADVSEVAPGNGEWDAIVGARILYRLSNLIGCSQGWLAIDS